MNNSQFVAFHLTDECNLRCKNCHWFSTEIKKSVEMPSVDQYLNFISKYPNIKIKLTGGEPTLYEGFLDLVNNIPITNDVIVCSNGENFDILKQIKRKVSFLISVNRDVDKTFFEQFKMLNQPYSFRAYTGKYKNAKDELEYGKTLEDKFVIGKKCLCNSNYIRFGSDGYAYNCELGLRNKEEKYRMGFSIFSGELNNNGIECEIRKECLSNFLYENKFTLK